MLILASESPRRRELLKRLRIPFDCVPARVTELAEGGDPASLPRRNALRKAAYVAARFPAAWVLGADTGVLAGNRLLGKPGSPEEAAEMLGTLQGREHRVVTGVALLCLERKFRRSWSVVSTVSFAPLSRERIAEYMKRVHVLDKAGAYAIQEHPELLGASWRGEVENIIGLPLTRLARILKECGVISGEARTATPSLRGHK